MNRSTIRLIAASSTLCFAALAAGCGAGSGGSSDDTVNLGMLQPLSGALAAYGAESQAGFEFVVDKINDAGGIESLDGAEIELTVADDASDPAKTASEARRLIGTEQVDMVVGALLTSQMAAVSPIADRFKTPVLSEFAGGSNSEYLYSLGNPYDDGYAATMTGFIDFLNTEHDAGLGTAALASSDYEAGQQVNAGLKPRLEEIGVEVLGEVPLETSGSDYKPAVTKLESMDPDVVVGLVTTEDGITLHQARAARDTDLQFIGGTGGYSDLTVWDSLGDGTAKKVLANNTFAMTTFSADADQPALQAFLEEAKAADLDVPIGQHFVQGAQAAWVVKHVLEEAGSTEAEDILAAFADVNIPAGSDELFLARENGITFDPETRFMNDPTAIMVQWNPDRTQKVVWPAAFATGEPELGR